ncbi:MAG: acyl--CoA ligase [Alphaproteobacteria bacterium]
MPHGYRTLIDRIASQPAAAVAVAAPERASMSYGALDAFIGQTRARLRDLGIGRGDRVAIVLPNGPEMAVAFVAVAGAATTAPLNPAYRAEEFAFYLQDLRARAVLVAADEAGPIVDAARQAGVAVLRAVVPADAAAGAFAIEGDPAGAASDDGAPGPDDIALILHTSGTTSRPKIVPLSHANIAASAQHIAATLGLGPADRVLNIMPLFHIHGLIAAVASSLGAGGSIWCSPGFNALRFFAWLDEAQATWVTAVPTMYQALLGRAERNAEIIARNPLRFLRSSSASLPPQVMQALEGLFGCPVIESYGMTEATHQMASNPLPPRPRKPGSVGVAAGPEIAILDERGAELAPGAIGEICIKGANVTAGYESNPDANAAAFTDGWFRTGDQGMLDAEGYLFITGRLKELINRGGEKIAPREVDEVLMDHPAVAQAVTFAVPHDKLGEEVAAAIVLRADVLPIPDAPMLKDFVAQRLADFKVPRTILIVDEIPKGPTGKLQRIGLAKTLGLAS